VSNYRHTPRNWYACEPGDYSDFDGRSIVILSDDPPIRIAVVQGDDDEAKANAALFVASPDMLAALQEVLKATGLQTGLQALCAAAVAKATGRSIEDVITGA
jgi:hypothetical protein